MNGLALCANVLGLELGIWLATGGAYRVVGVYEKRRAARIQAARNIFELGWAAAFRDDIRSSDFRCWAGCVDIISAGWPCQGFSTASRGRKTHPDLWRFVRKAIVQSRAPWVFLENVNEAPWPVVESQLQRLGFRVARDRFCPSSLGAPHRRPRTFLLAHADREGQSLGPVDAEMARVSQIARRDYDAVPEAIRVGNGIPGRVDQFRMAGEGAIPAVAARAFVTLARRLA